MALTLYGIKNCDTVRKARRWLDDHDIDYLFHDFRADGTDSAELQRWLACEGWENVVNRRSTSWKALSESTRESMNDSSALREIAVTPTLIKRPVLSDDNILEFGFSAQRYAELLAPGHTS